MSVTCSRGHDVGKIGIAEDILVAAPSLTPAQELPEDEKGVNETY